MAWMLAGVLSLGGAAIAQAQQATEATQKAIAVLEERWAQAERTNSIEMEAPLLADKFAQTDSDGKVLDRAHYLADDKATKYTSVGLEDLHVTVLGNTAIARYVAKSKGTDAEGKPFDSNARWTDTWVKMPSGKWQCVASHGSRVKT
jgi:ketosteroid isomerase-like protein